MYQGQPIMLKRYLSGQVCDVLEDTMLHQIGTEMARLHAIPPPEFLSHKLPYDLDLFSSVIGVGINLPYETWLAEQLQYFKQHLPLNLPRGLIHADLFYDNVLFKGKLKAIIDFEDACYYYKVFDVGIAVIGLCTEATKLVPSKIDAFLAGYQHVRHLETGEKENLPLFIEYAATITSYWRFWKYNIHMPEAKKAHHHELMVVLAKDARALPKD